MKPHHRRPRPHVVTALFNKSAEVLLQITVDVSGSSGADTQPLAGDPAGDEVSGADPPTGSEVESFTVTPEHPFWQADTETWTLAGDLAVGDELLQRDGDRIAIVAVETLERAEPFTVYNFTVDGTHNYYATAVETLVHNCPTKVDYDDEEDRLGAGLQRGADRGRTIESINDSLQEFTKGLDSGGGDSDGDGQADGLIAEIGLPASGAPPIGPLPYSQPGDGSPILAGVILAFGVWSGIRHSGGRFGGWLKKPGTDDD